MIYRRTDHAAWRNLGDETVLIDLSAKVMYGLNETAGHLWQALDGTTDLAELGRSLAASDRAPEVKPAALEDFCTALANLGLLKEVELDADATEVSKVGEAAPWPPPGAGEVPKITWREPIKQVAATCGFLPAQGGPCLPKPMS